MSTMNDAFPKDGIVALQYAVDNKTGAIGVVNGFITGKIGRKITVTSGSTTDTYAYTDNGQACWTITVTYTDATKAVVSTVERTA